jgi:hypothetical protein
MSAIRRSKHVRSTALRMAVKLVRQHRNRVRGAADVTEARARLARETAATRGRFEARIPAKDRATHFDDALAYALDLALRGLPIELPEVPKKEEQIEPLPDLEPIVDGSYRDAPPSKRKPRARGPLVAPVEEPRPPLFVEDPNHGPASMLKLFGVLLAIAQALALVWAAGTHASRGSYLTAVMLIALLFGVPIVIAWQELTTPPDPR